MRQNFLFILCLLNTQTLFAQSLEQNLQELAREIMIVVKNPEQNLGLLTDIQDILREHSDFLFNTLPGIQTDPEFEPYIKKYEALKGQYMGDGQSIPINPDIKIVLSAAPFSKDVSYSENIEGSGLCRHPFLIIIDRGFWEYYQNNDEIRQAVIIHELGHCDLNQEHGYNDIMNIVWQDDLLNRKTIDWHPLYEEFFMIYKRNEVIVVCSEENMHLYEGCSSLKFLGGGGFNCPEKESGTCYQLREDFISLLRSYVPYPRCLLFNSDGSVCSRLRPY